MKAKYMFITVSLAFSFLFIAAPNSLRAQQPGCCRSTAISPGGVCIACEGQSCVTTSTLCDAEDGFFTPADICETTNDGAVCVAGPPIGLGCCVVPPQQQPECIDGVGIESCILGENGAVWVAGESCSNVSLCQEPIISRNVPTLTEWGLIALAGTLGIIGLIMVIRRNKVTV